MNKVSLVSLLSCSVDVWKLRLLLFILVLGVILFAGSTEACRHFRAEGMCVFRCVFWQYGHVYCAEVIDTPVSVQIHHTVRKLGFTLYFICKKKKAVLFVLLMCRHVHKTTNLCARLFQTWNMSKIKDKSDSWPTRGAFPFVIPLLLWCLHEFHRFFCKNEKEDDIKPGSGNFLQPEVWVSGQNQRDLIWGQ